MISMILIPYFHMNHHFQEKIVNMYMSRWNQTTTTMKLWILILRGHPISRNSSLSLDHIQLFTNDNCKILTRKLWHEFLRHYCIGNSTTETHHPNQKPAKRKIQDLKNNVNHIVDHTNTPTLMWLRCIIFWLWCWIVLQCPPLVGGNLRRFS